MVAAKRKGRPPRSEKGAATVNLTMRLRPDLYDEIRADAARNGRSISAEAESRLSQPPTNELGRMVGLVVDTVERRTGKSSSSDQATRIECAGAILAMHTLLFGVSMPPKDRIEHWLANTKKDRAHALAENDSERAEILEGSIASLQGQLDVIAALGADGRGVKQ